MKFKDPIYDRCPVCYEKLTKVNYHNNHKYIKCDNVPYYIRHSFMNSLGKSRVVIKKSHLILDIIYRLDHASRSSYQSLHCNEVLKMRTFDTSIILDFEIPTSFDEFEKLISKIDKRLLFS